MRGRTGRCSCCALRQLLLGNPLDLQGEPIGAAALIGGGKLIDPLQQVRLGLDREIAARRGVGCSDMSNHLIHL
jgi:hypothetical protein